MTKSGARAKYMDDKEIHDISPASCPFRAVMNHMGVELESGSTPQVSDPLTDYYGAGHGRPPDR